MNARGAYRIVNLGCKVNRVESDAVEAAFVRAGFAVAEEGHADIVVVNTCTVTGEAEKKTRKAVHRVVRDEPTAQIIVTGCSVAIHPEEYRIGEDRIRIVPKAELFSAVRELCEGAREEHVSGESATAVPRAAMRRGVKVQDGCDRTCTYCIVHVARGPASSVPADKVIEECRALMDVGIPEVVLTGINLGAYQDGGTDLALLLRRLLKELELEKRRSRLRLSSIEPQDVADELISVIASAEGSICRHLHLPLQSGSSKVLREMDRGYDAEGFADVVQRLRTAIPMVSLSTDIIAGFPGETDEDFEETYELCRQSRFMKLHVFPYSMRVGTPAAAREDQVPAAVKAERAARLRALSDELCLEDLAFRAGTEEVAVVESARVARTESYHVLTPPAGASIGALIPVRFSTTR